MQSNQNNKNGRARLASEALRAGLARHRYAQALRAGRIESYIHSNGRIGVLLELFCQTDFASRTPEFRELTHDLAMQVAAMGKKDLLKQRYIKNLEMTVSEIVQEKAEKLGEEIKIGRVVRYRL